MKKLLAFPALLLVTAGLTAVPSARADENHRYYDRHHRDYHEWSPDEDRRFTIYLNEHHLKLHTWDHSSAAQRQRYWDWRHDHPER
jgi:hypothetical protein